MQAAVLAARAKAAKAHQGRGFWARLGNPALGGVAWAGEVVLGGVDPVTDGATVVDGAEATDLTGTGIAEITGSASAFGVATAEEEAASQVVVDGEKVGGRVADDVVAGADTEITKSIQSQIARDVRRTGM